MQRLVRTVIVNNIVYRVVEHAGMLKADLRGYYGWTKVWAEDYPSLVKRIKLVRSGGQ